MLLTRFRIDFASSVWNFCRLVADVPLRETSLSGDKQGETSAIRRLATTTIIIIIIPTTIIAFIIITIVIVVTIIIAFISESEN